MDVLTNTYAIVNDIANQAMGREDIKVTSTQGLVSLGNTILESNTYTENFMNKLTLRIGRTIISVRAYENKFKDFMRDNFAWGLIVQKISFGDFEAEEDESYNLEDGKSVDPYKVKKPKVNQSLFVTSAPYQFKLTEQRVHLKEAFTSDTGMVSFIQGCTTTIKNKINKSFEELGRLTLANYIAEVSDKEARRVHLITEYNAEVDASETIADANKALHSKEFLNYAVARINETSDYMEELSYKYNDGTVPRHTPKELQKLFVLSNFERRLETVTQYQAFHKEMVSLNNYKTISYWQAENDRDSVKVARASDNKETTVDNVVATLFDYEALGMYKQDEWVATTPLNAAGGYINTYWHEKQLWFNDLSENFILFTLD